MSPRWQLWIGKLDINRTDSEDGHGNRFLYPGRHSVIMKCACRSFHVAARGHRHCHFRCEIGTAVDPPCAGNHDLDAIGCSA